MKDGENKPLAASQWLPKDVAKPQVARIAKPQATLSAFPLPPSAFEQPVSAKHTATTGTIHAP